MKKEVSSMFLLVSIIFVICVILLVIIRNTIQYANNFVRVDFGHILNLLSMYRFCGNLS